MKKQDSLSFNRLLSFCTSTDNEASDISGCWNIHTHRRKGDMRHAIWSCGWMEESILSECSDKAPFYISVGIHPLYLTEENFPAQWQWLLRSVHDKRVLAIGEAGLDKAVKVPFDLQVSVFRQVAGLADELRLPLVIHAVKASNEIIRLKKEMNPHNPWIIHGFRGKTELAQTYLQHDIYLSFGEKYQEESLCITPLDHLFLETDESETDICELCRRTAKIRKIPEEELREKIRQNINKLFFR